MTVKISGRPSPSTSPTAKLRLIAEGKLTKVPNEDEPIAPAVLVLGNTPTMSPPKTRSVLPSPFKSANVGEEGVVVRAKSKRLLKVNEPTALVLRKTAIVLRLKLVTNTSRLPSPSKSCVFTHFAPNPAGGMPAPVIRLASVAKLIDPGELVLRNIETVCSFVLGTAMSGLPSPSKSATFKNCGLLPAVSVMGAAKELASSTPAVATFFKTNIPLEKELTMISGFPSKSMSAMAA